MSEIEIGPAFITEMHPYDFDPRFDIKVKRLNKNLPMPRKAHPTDAGIDLRCTEGVVLNMGEKKVVGTGIAVAMPELMCGMVLIRSGIAKNQGVTILNSPGLIDSHYRGEIKLILAKTSGEGMVVFPEGERIAQLVFVPIPPVKLTEVEDLDDTDRGDGGFGSTGVY